MTRLDDDTLGVVVSWIPAGDLLPTALTCTRFRDICSARASLEPRTMCARVPQTHKAVRWKTRAVSSANRAKWAIVMGATPEAGWCTAAASQGDLELLQCGSWVHHGMAMRTKRLQRKGTCMCLIFSGNITVSLRMSAKTWMRRADWTSLFTVVSSSRLNGYTNVVHNGDGFKIKEEKQRGRVCRRRGGRMRMASATFEWHLRDLLPESDDLYPQEHLHHSCQRHELSSRVERRGARGHTIL